jgi:integrase
MYLLTGCRKMELVNLRWDEIDEDGRRIRLSASRNKSGTIIYKELSALAMAILLSLPRDQLYVFPGRYRNTRMKEVSSLWRKVRAEAGLHDVVLHDLRRTTGSWLAQGGESLHMIAKILGQTTDHVTKTYAHFENQHKKDAVERLADKLAPFIDPSLYNS